MSALEQDIFSLVLTQMKREHPYDQFYRVSISDLEELYGKKINYQDARKGVNKILDRKRTIIRENGNVLDVELY